ncbi:hypothetical protein ABK905_23055 [Acerihabitans sp. KWT182]|uniref:Uncharacterized protein n=1 Tax=Acerihabitans sp. KWT182 TaxID=3157919 RepID=A0AAU7QA77_9GAMM
MATQTRSGGNRREFARRDSTEREETAKAGFRPRRLCQRSIAPDINARKNRQISNFGSTAFARGQSRGHQRT